MKHSVKTSVSVADYWRVAGVCCQSFTLERATPLLALTNKRPVAVIGELFQDQSRAQSDEQSRRSSVKVLRIQQSGRGPLLLLGELLCQTKDL